MQPSSSVIHAARGRAQSSVVRGSSRVNLSDTRTQESVLKWMTATSSNSGHQSAASSQSAAAPEQPSAVAPPVSVVVQPQHILQEAQSVELFSHAVPTSPLVHDPLPSTSRQSLVSDHDDDDLTDAQTWDIFEEVAQVVGPAAESSLLAPLMESEDETMVQDADVYMEEAVADDDDEVLDPTWREATVSHTETSDEEWGGAEETVARPPATIVVEPQLNTASSLTAAPLTVSPHSRPQAASHGRTKSSMAWEFFKLAEGSTDVICKLCGNRYSRGTNRSNLTSSVMTRHLQQKHEIVWQSHLQKCGQAVPAATTTSTSQRRAVGIATAVSSAAVGGVSGNVGPSIAPQSVRAKRVRDSTQDTIQPSVSQMWARKSPWPNSNPKAQSLNFAITKLLASEMLPFRLVETEDFRGLFSLACPRYQIPSRHFFSKTAMPELHRHVVENITNALRKSMCKKVHFTTDTWTSKHGQGRYITLTAHWVNLVSQSAGGAGGEALQVMKAPRLAGQTAVHGTSAAQSSPFSSSGSGMRRQAILHMRCLGDRCHTGDQLWAAISEDIQNWLTPNNLELGKVVSDNGSNLLAAFRLGGLTHVPCMAHVLNLIVQKFLKHYPGLQVLLEKVRSLCAHFRRSPTASARLAALQRSQGLPVNRLQCDIPTRWNSTLHMLQRLCQQRQAVVQYVVGRRLGQRSADTGHFSPSEWAQMKDLCAVLSGFDTATNMFSADDALISITVPVIHLLEHLLSNMRYQVQPLLPSDEEEEEEAAALTQVPTAGEGELRPAIGAFQSHERPTDMAFSGHVVQEDEADPASGPYDDVEELQHSQFLQGWMDEEEEADDAPHLPPTAARTIGAQGSVSHMSAFMLHYLQHDPRVQKVKSSMHYWLATLLDPRYVSKLADLIPAAERSERMAEYKAALLRNLSARHPSDPGPGQPSSAPIANPAHSHSSAGETNFGLLWGSFFARPNPASRACGSGQENASRLQNQIVEYLVLNFEAFPEPPDPFHFWCARLNQWPELAQYALELLSCPAASVLSERVFSTAGGILTDRRLRLSKESVDRLTLIKMNRGWISRCFKVADDPINV